MNNILSLCHVLCWVLTGYTLLFPVLFHYILFSSFHDYLVPPGVLNSPVTAKMKGPGCIGAVKA